MAVLRPARRDSISYNPNKGDNTANMKRMNSFSAFANGRGNTFYEIPAIRPLPRRHYSSAGYSASPCGSSDTKSNSQQSRICNIRYRPIPPPTMIPQIHCYNDRRNGPYITEISPDPPSKVPSVSRRQRQRVPRGSDTTLLDPDSIDSDTSKALVPSKGISLETSSKLTVTAELAPPPSSRQRRITGDSFSASINRNDVYNALKETASVVAVQRKSEPSSQHRQGQCDEKKDRVTQRRESLVSMIPRPPMSNVTTVSRVAKVGRKSSSGSEAGRSFDETTVHQSVKFYSTSAQCYLGDSSKSHSSHDDGGETETMSVKESRELHQLEVTSVQSSSKATIGIHTRKQSTTRSVDSFQSESRFPPVIVSAIPKLNYKNRERSDESKELLVCRSFETSEARSTRGSGSTNRKSTVSSSNSKHSSKHHERCRRPSASVKPRERR